MADFKPYDNKELKKIITEKKPNINKSSIQAYASTVKNFLNKNKVSLDDINNSVLVKSYLQDLTPNQRKTLYAGLLVFTTDEDAQKDYRKSMLDDVNAVKIEDMKNKKTEKQNDYWLDWDKVLLLHKFIESKVKPLWVKQKNTDEELEEIQNYVILSLYVLSPPRRLDYALMKWRGNIDDENDNYIYKFKKFIFNKYKTNKTYGRQEVDIDKKLEKILKMWSVKNKSDYLLVDSLGQPMSNVKLNKRLNAIFKDTGKPVSVNALRHSYITSLYPKDMPTLETLNNIAEDMGHSIATQQLYIKK